MINFFGSALPHEDFIYHVNNSNTEYLGAILPASSFLPSSSGINPYVSGKLPSLSGVTPSVSVIISEAEGIHPAASGMISSLSGIKPAVSGIIPAPSGATTATAVATYEHSGLDACNSFFKIRFIIPLD